MELSDIFHGWLTVPKLKTFRIVRETVREQEERRSRFVAARGGAKALAEEEAKLRPGERVIVGEPDHRADGGWSGSPFAYVGAREGDVVFRVEGAEANGDDTHWFGIDPVLRRFRGWYDATLPGRIYGPAHSGSAGLAIMLLQSFYTVPLLPALALANAGIWTAEAAIKMDRYAFAFYKVAEGQLPSEDAALLWNALRYEKVRQRRAKQTPTFDEARLILSGSHAYEKLSVHWHQGAKVFDHSSVEWFDHEGECIASGSDHRTGLSSGDRRQTHVYVHSARFYGPEAEQLIPLGHTRTVKEDRFDFGPPDHPVP